MRNLRTFWNIARRTIPVAASAALMVGCATARLNDARSQFYRGNPAQAAQTLDQAPTTGKDRVLVLMERGMSRQAAGEYEASVRDFIQASDDLENMTAIQVSKDTTSLVVNDTVQDFRGAPYERTMLHVFAALSHLGMGNFENAAVEARRIIQSLTPEAKGDYPDDAFSRYMAGFCLQMMDDPSNAALQFRKAAELAPSVSMDDKTGRLADKDATPDTGAWDSELICFVLTGRISRGDDPWARSLRSTHPTYGEIIINGRPAGRSFILTDTVDLAFTTDQKEATKKAIKTASRIALKETIAYQLDKDNAALGALARLVLIGLLEQPDTRRWETLPRWLEVARVPCPADLKEFEVVFRTSAGVELRRQVVSTPLAHRRTTFVSFVRDLR